MGKSRKVLTESKRNVHYIVIFLEFPLKLYAKIKVFSSSQNCGGHFFIRHQFVIGSPASLGVFFWVKRNLLHLKWFHLFASAVQHGLVTNEGKNKHEHDLHINWHGHEYLADVHIFV